LSDLVLLSLEPNLSRPDFITEVRTIPS